MMDENNERAVSEEEASNRTLEQATNEAACRFGFSVLLEDPDEPYATAEFDARWYSALKEQLGPDAMPYVARSSRDQEGTWTIIFSHVDNAYRFFATTEGDLILAVLLLGATTKAERHLGATRR